MVEFAATPPGSVVSSVGFSIDREIAQTDRVRADVLAKYGRPTVARDSLGSAWWCRDSESDCDRVSHTDTVLEFSDKHGITIRLTDVNRMRRETNAAIVAEVDQRYPKRAASF